MIEWLLTHGDLLTRVTIWLALCLYAAGMGLLLLARNREPLLVAARAAWTIGCGLFLAHVFCAFQFFHAWSHSAALEETARETAAMTGFRSGSGLYLNYLFGFMWIGAVLGWWLAPGRFLRMPHWAAAAGHGFALFMILNGTVVFGKGPVRLLGVLICGGLILLWWWQRRRASTYPDR